MESIVEQLRRIGLTEYEAKAYVALLTVHLSTALTVSKKAGVPRTRIYAVLESLQTKGWIKIYSGVLLLFKAEEPISRAACGAGRFWAVPRGHSNDAPRRDDSVGRTVCNQEI